MDQYITLETDPSNPGIYSGDDGVMYRINEGVSVEDSVPGDSMPGIQVLSDWLKTNAVVEAASPSETKQDSVTNNASEVDDKKAPLKVPPTTKPRIPDVSINTVASSLDPCRQNPIFTYLNIILIIMLVVFSVNFMTVIPAGSTSKIKGNVAIAATFLSLGMAVSVVMQTPMVSEYIKQVTRSQSQKNVAYLYPAVKKAAILKAKFGDSKSDQEIREIVAKLEGVYGSEERDNTYAEYPLHEYEKEIETQAMIDEQLSTL